MKKVMLIASMLCGLNAYGQNAETEELEICVSSGQCALRVHAEEISGTVYLVRKSDAKVLRSLWSGAAFYIVDENDYDEIRAWLPEETLTLPAVNPSQEIMAQGGKSGGTAPIQGPIIGGNITVTVGGGNSSCSDCHTGSMREIHKKVMKPTGGGK